MEKKYDVFISYSSHDQKVVEAICAYLEQHKIRCFVAYRDIPKGVVWAESIVRALDSSSIMLVAFSNHFNASEQVNREIELAAEDKKPILTFRLSNDAFEGAKKYYLKNINWIDAFPEPEKQFDALLKNVMQLLGMEPKTSPTSSETEIERLRRQLEEAEAARKKLESLVTGSSTKEDKYKTFTVNGVSFKMIKVEGGTFQMGSANRDYLLPVIERQRRALGARV